MPQSSSCLCNMLIKFDTVQAQAAMTLRCQALWDRPAQITAGRGVVPLPRLLRACLTCSNSEEKYMYRIMLALLAVSGSPDAIVDRPVPPQGHQKQDWQCRF